MANELLNSPAEVIAELLIHLGVGTDPDADEAWPVYVDELNDAIDQVITVQDTLGTPDGQAQVTGELLCHFGFQVLVRAKHPRDGWRKADEVRQALATSGETGTNASEGTIVIVEDGDGSGHAYGVLSVNQISPVIRNGREPTSARRRWSVNATATIRPYSFPAALAYYPLDADGSDASGNGKDIAPTIDTDMAFVEGRVGKSLSFKSGRTYARDNDVLTGRVVSANYSLAAWFRHTGTSSDGAVSASGDGGTVGVVLQVGNAEINVDFIDATYESAHVAVTANEWHHAVVSVHDDGTADLYVDGTWVDTIRNMTDPTVFSADAQGFYVGGGGTTGARADDVVVVSDALTSAEVAALWARGYGRPYPVA